MLIRNQQRLKAEVNRTDGFTIVELLAVAVVIGALSAMLIGAAGYIKRKTDVDRVHIEMAAMSLALENYKLDYGSYPTSTSYRVSATGVTELSNSIALYRAIGGYNGKTYYRFRPDQLKTNSIYGTFTNTDTYVVDPWGSPYNYIRMAKIVPLTNSHSFCYYGWVNSGTNLPFGVTSGQVNTVTFDLWSYGPDRVTPVPYGNPGWGWNAMCITPGCFGFAADDIVNWR